MVTTGLKCAPDTGPSARISATSPAPVAIEFSSSWSPTSCGESRCAADPRADDDGDEQRGADTFRRRPAGEFAFQRRISSSGRPTPAPPHNTSGQPRARRCAARPVPSRRRRARCRSPTARGRDRRPTPCPAPRSSTRPRPRLRSQGPARQARLGGAHVVGRLDLDAEMVQRSRITVTLDEHELERRLGDGEVGVARAELGRFGGEQLGVEVDRVVEVRDVQGELHSAHGRLRSRQV